MPARLRPAWILIGILALILLLMNYSLWVGDHGETAVIKMRDKVAEQTRENDGLRQRNASLAAEVEDLKSGEAAVEERARNELGMIKPGETFYRVVPPAAMKQVREQTPEQTKAAEAAAAQIAADEKEASAPRAPLPSSTPPPSDQ